MHALNVAEVVLRNKRPHVSGRRKPWTSEKISLLQVSFYCATHSTVAASKERHSLHEATGTGQRPEKNRIRC